MNVVAKDFLREEFSLSNEQNEITLNLKKAIFCIIHKALVKHYGDNYSVRCLQSTYGIMTIMDYFGVRSVLVEGAACFGLVYGKNPYRITWGGFWNNDHHYWLVSQYGDIIDFTVSQLHLHPAEKYADQIPILPIWWSPIGVAPPIFRYLQKVFGKPLDMLEAEESAKLKEFNEYILNHIEEGTLDSNELDKIDILTGPEKFQQLYLQKNTWIHVFIEKHKELEWPDWILQREQELMENYNKKRNSNNGT